MILFEKKRGKQMAKKYLEKNVLDATIERLEVIFQFEWRQRQFSNGTIS